MSESSEWERNYQIAQFSGCGIDAADLAEAFGISEEKVQEYANLLQEGGLKAICRAGGLTRQFFSLGAWSAMNAWSLRLE